jgi:hypothetical protein
MGSGPIVYEEKADRKFMAVLPGSHGQSKLEAICKTGKQGAFKIAQVAVTTAIPHVLAGISCR